MNPPEQVKDKDKSWIRCHEMGSLAGAQWVTGENDKNEAFLHIGADRLSFVALFSFSSPWSSLSIVLLSTSSYSADSFHSKTSWWLKGTLRVNYYNYITHKDTQPSRACSGGYIFLLLYATVVFGSDYTPQLQRNNDI